jgi:hypothetical protein
MRKRVSKSDASDEQLIEPHRAPRSCVSASLNRRAPKLFALWWRQSQAVPRDVVSGGS